MVSRLQLPPEIQLAQRLAGNEQVTRDRAVRKLRKYIVARTQRAAGYLSGGRESTSCSWYLVVLRAWSRISSSIPWTCVRNADSMPCAVAQASNPSYSGCRGGRIARAQESNL
uniref:Ribosomal RNA processing 1 n=1 Tax=Theropithecus gelada TaxID=9565 RepID=A0A8D2FLU8_THEGE